MKGFHEDFLVRFRIHLDQEVVSPLENLVIAGGEVVKRRILDHKSAITHAVFHSHNGVAGSAGQTSLSLRRVDLLFNGRVKSAIEEDRVIVAAGAPLGGLDPSHILHVLDGFSIPLIIERRKMVHGRVPLLVDVRMATLARLRSHEKVGRNGLPGCGGGGRRKERAVGSVTFFIHRGRSADGIANPIPFGGNIMAIDSHSQGKEQQRGQGQSITLPGQTKRLRGALLHLRSESQTQNEDRKQGQSDMQV